MDLNPEYLKDLDPLAVTNTVTISALVALLVRKGVLSEQELTEEVRKIRSRVDAMGADRGSEKQ